MQHSSAAQRLRYYTSKCVQHLSRVRLSHALALDGLTIEAEEPEFNEILLAAFDTRDEGQREAKLHRGLHELHLTALKAEFELYLNRLLTVIWDEHFPRLATDLKRRSKYTLRDLAGAVIEGKTSKEFIIEKVVPTHGLEQFVDGFESATAINIPKVISQRGPSLWQQIKVAFEVRHLIEHRDGRVDVRFREHVKPYWEHSSWGRLEVELEQVARVPVDNEDVIVTYDAMRQAAEAFMDALVRWDARCERPRSFQNPRAARGT